MVVALWVILASSAYGVRFKFGGSLEGSNMYRGSLKFRAVCLLYAVAIFRPLGDTAVYLAQALDMGNESAYIPGALEIPDQHCTVTLSAGARIYTRFYGIQQLQYLSGSQLLGSLLSSLDGFAISCCASTW